MFRWYKRGRLAFNFTENHPKGLGKHLKTKRFELNEKNQESVQIQAEHVLYLQYFPLPLIAGQVLYNFGVPADMAFLQGADILQYYLSGLVCFNSFFTKVNQKKYYAMIISVTLANCLPGVYSLVAPLILGFWNFYLPFTNEKLHRFDDKIQVDKFNTYLRVQGIYTFLVMLLLTLKFYHYSEVYSLEKKIKSFQADNNKFYQADIKQNRQKIVA